MTFLDENDMVVTQTGSMSRITPVAYSNILLDGGSRRGSDNYMSGNPYQNEPSRNNSHSDIISHKVKESMQYSLIFIVEVQNISMQQKSLGVLIKRFFFHSTKKKKI